MNNKNKLAITDVVLRDAHQSLFATRLRLEDMLPIASKLDQVGYRSLETWGGATFDACIRYLGEDPWERLRELKKAIPNTPMQMLLRGQNILGSRHYADDVVEKFVERAASNGMDIFRIFDAMNDLRNLETAIKATIKVDKHAQGTLSYTTSPVHNLEYWLNMARGLEDFGCHSLCIKDMAGLLTPYTAFELVKKLKQIVDLPLYLHAHATTGMSTATILKASEAGIDGVDTSISSMSMTYGHSATESLVAILKGTDRDTNLNLTLLEEIAAYFRIVRSKYENFEGSLKGVDSRILVSQVPGGMLTNMENQLKEQNALDKLDDVLNEIPSVRKDLGYIPLVTPTSQIVGTQAVLNVLSGKRYKNMSKETAGVLKGEYGATPSPVNKDLQTKVLSDGEEAITCRPADLLENELQSLKSEFKTLKKDLSLNISENEIDDVLIYALFPQIGLKFLKNRNNKSFFEDSDTLNSVKGVHTDKSTSEAYDVVVDNKSYRVIVAPEGTIRSIESSGIKEIEQNADKHFEESQSIFAPLSGNIFKINVSIDQKVASGDIVMILEAMKMETEVRATIDGVIKNISVKEGDVVQVGDILLNLK